MPAWLGEQPVTVRDLKAMLIPYPFDGMICWPVSTRVGNVRNNDSSLIHWAMLLEISRTIEFFPLARPRESPGLPPPGFSFRKAGALSPQAPP